MPKAILLLVPLFIFSCQKPIDFEEEKKKIQAQIDLVEEAHFSKDATQFYQPNADSWYDVRGGEVQQLNKSDQIPATQSYLDDMDFHQMIKRDDPIIEISEDATMASYIGSIMIKGMLNESPVFWVVSWQSVLKKIKGEWKIISSANTEADKAMSARVLLTQIRSSLGVPDGLNSIYAYAECQGPASSFKTLILSGKTVGKMEQVNGDSHLIMKHGGDSTWTYNLKTNALIERDPGFTGMFVKGHELHWLSFRPEDRYTQATLKEITEFHNQRAFHIECKDSFDRPVNFYYSFDTYIPLGFTLQTNDQGDQVTVTFENWEKIHDISVFKTATFTDNNGIFTYNYLDIKFNQINTQDFESKIGLIK